MAALRYLESIGWNVLGTNIRCGRSEIDIVAEDDGTLVFVEVRARRGKRLGTPEESVTPQKRRQMLTAASRYLTMTNAWHRNWRIDVVAVELDHLERVSRLNVIRNAVEM